MAYCTKCGTQVNPGTAFCPQCGTAIDSATAAPYPPPAPQSYAPAASSGLSENVAGGLCYSLFWFTGIIFLFVDKRPFVRFHAAQSIIVFGILHIVREVVLYTLLAGGSYAFGAAFFFHALVGGILFLVTIALWLVLMILAFQHKEFAIPGVGPLAKSLASKV